MELIVHAATSVASSSGRGGSPQELKLLSKDSNLSPSKFAWVLDFESFSPSAPHLMDRPLKTLDRLLEKFHAALR